MILIFFFSNCPLTNAVNALMVLVNQTFFFSNKDAYLLWYHTIKVNVSGICKKPCQDKRFCSRYCTIDIVMFFVSWKSIAISKMF